jgi:hypothetical protein
VRSDARNQASVLEDQAEVEAIHMEQRAGALSQRAKQAGGFTGGRFEVQADAFRKEAKIVREQAGQQADAIKEAADARIKAFESR